MNTQKNRTVRQKGHYKLINGDCLEVMKQIPDKSIDMILCDPPYGTIACKWDNIIPFEFLWKEYERIIKNNGAILLFGSGQFTHKLIYSNEKEIVLDNCMGSGSTGVACINTNRKFVGIELNEHYFNVSCDRIKQAYQEKQDYGEW